MDAKCESFPFVADAHSRVLVLGTMPGVRSLEARQYYAHPQNAFWRIMTALWALPCPHAYEARIAHLLARRVALWDVLATCERAGSSDTAIRCETPQDFAPLFTLAPFIHTVFCNGRAARTLFMRHGAQWAAGRAVIQLPSTSPANTMPFAVKLNAWQCVREAAEAERACPQPLACI